MKEKAYLQSDAPFGYICCSAGDCPKVRFANEQMLRMLHTTAESENWKAFIAQNLFFMVPFEDHGLFRE